MLATLRDGTQVRIRPIRADDKERLARGFARLSQETVRRRFLGAKDRLTSAELRYLTEVDGRDHLALVALISHDPEALVAVGRFVRLPEDPATAEFAITVVDQLQGRGLGTLLIDRLAKEARARGIHAFTGTVLSENPAARRLMDRIEGRLVVGPHRDGTQAVRIDLAA